MNVLLTGASSFSGYWFAHALAERGCAVTAVLPRRQAEYEGLRALRVAHLPDACRKVFAAPFGSRAFMRVISGQPHWDALCHHAAYVRDYKSPNFDVAAAVSENTRNAPVVLDALAEQGCRRVVLTGSVFEAGEGGGRSAPALSPYGLSKSLTTAYYRYYAQRQRLRFGHFVIPNPFGPMEEPRFTAYLINCWKENETAVVRTPEYLRDNIHVSLLALAYAQFVTQLPARAGASRRRPSGYVETQGAFTRRFAREMRRRLGLPCAVSLPPQQEFSEPMKRVNTQPVPARALGWSEKAAWDDIAAFYR